MLLHFEQLIFIAGMVTNRKGRKWYVIKNPSSNEKGFLTDARSSLGSGVLTSVIKTSYTRVNTLVKK